MDRLGERQRTQTPTRVARCLIGFQDGRKVFKVVAVEPKQLAIIRRPGGEWILQGWFCEDLLDE